MLRGGGKTPRLSHVSKLAEGVALRFLEGVSDWHVCRVRKNGPLISLRATILAVSQWQWWVWQMPVLPQVALQLDARGSSGSQELERRNNGDTRAFCRNFYGRPLGSRHPTARQCGSRYIICCHFWTAFDAEAGWDAKLTVGDAFQALFYVEAKTVGNECGREQTKNPSRWHCLRSRRSS